MSRTWQEIVDTKRAVRDHLVHQQSRIEKTQQHEQLAGIHDVSNLQELLAFGDLTAEDVVRAYIDR